MPQLPDARTLNRAAAVGTALAGVTFVSLGVAALAQQHAAFSLGVGIVLVAYGLLVCAIAWFGWRGATFASGAMIAAGLLHLATAASYATGDGWFWAVLIAIVPLVTVILAVLGRR